MFTSDRKKAVEYAYKLFNYACICLTAAIFCALFGAVYEVFSHGVFSFYMIYAFAIPLCLGTFPLMIILLCAGRKTEKLEIIDLKEAETLYEEDRYWENSCLYLFPGRTALNAWFSGIAALTVGCLFQGVLEIYGTTNRWTAVYVPAAALLFITAAGVAVVKRKGPRGSRRVPSEDHSGSFKERAPGKQSGALHPPRRGE